MKGTIPTIPLCLRTRCWSHLYDSALPEVRSSWYSGIRSYHYLQLLNSAQWPGAWHKVIVWSLLSGYLNTSHFSRQPVAAAHCLFLRRAQKSSSSFPQAQRLERRHLKNVKTENPNKTTSKAEIFMLRILQSQLPSQKQPSLFTQGPWRVIPFGSLHQSHRPSCWSGSTNIQLFFLCQPESLLHQCYSAGSHRLQ